MRPYRFLATGAAVAGLTLTMQACTSSAGTTTPAAPTPAAVESSPEAPEGTEGTGAAPASTASVDQILTGDRKVLIHIAEDDKDWSATYEGPIAIGDGTDDGALFRIVPAAGDQYLIESLRPREEGGRWCASGNTGNEPVSLTTGKCAEKDIMLFGITATGEKDDKGRPTHRITSKKFGTVQVKNDGSSLYIQEVGDGGSRGSFSFVDRGAVKE